MNEERNNQPQAAEPSLSEILQVRRDKLKALQDAGRNPFEQTRFARSAYSADIKEDRKSTRLNSSHITISYAVFCLI